MPAMVDILADNDPLPSCESHRPRVRTQHSIVDPLGIPHLNRIHCTDYLGRDLPSVLPRMGKAEKTTLGMDVGCEDTNRPGPLRKCLQSVAEKVITVLFELHTGDESQGRA
jgi:hypothetical protein